MKKWVPTVLALALAAGPLAAQESRFGLTGYLGIPTGDFNGITYPNGDHETYDTGIGVQFTISTPLDRQFALRFNTGVTAFEGNYDSYNYGRYSAHHSMWHLGGEAQLFLGDGNAMRHIGSYLIGGLEADFERFAYGDDYYDSSYDNAIRKTRLGMTAGFGHAFRSTGRGRWVFEAVFHKTLTANDTANGDMPSADFVKLGVGFVF